jgi:hypothetical protein
MLLRELGYRLAPQDSGDYPKPLSGINAVIRRFRREVSACYSSDPIIGSSPKSSFKYTSGRARKRLTIWYGLIS